MGDCNGDGAVSVGEIVTCVNIALLTSPVESCTDCDGNGDGKVGIDELIRSVAVALQAAFPYECASRRCEESSGSVSSASCCLSATDFPDTCAIGACSCTPENSHEVAVCDCGAGSCFDGFECVSILERACRDAGGTVEIGLCCDAVGDFPDTCAIGACSCTPQNSHEVLLCDCGAQRCWNGFTCGEQ